MEHSTFSTNAVVHTAAIREGVVSESFIQPLDNQFLLLPFATGFERRFHTVIKPREPSLSGMGNGAQISVMSILGGIQ